MSAECGKERSAIELHYTPYQILFVFYPDTLPPWPVFDRIGQKRKRNIIIRVVIALIVPYFYAWPMVEISGFSLSVFEKYANRQPGVGRFPVILQHHQQFLIVCRYKCGFVYRNMRSHPNSVHFFFGSDNS
jgi:hypothetical protein